MPFATIQKVRECFTAWKGRPDGPFCLLAFDRHRSCGCGIRKLRICCGIFRSFVTTRAAMALPMRLAGDYSIEMLGRDVLGLADGLRISEFAFCGLSLGGAIGQWMAANAPERVTHLILANTSPQFASASNWNARIETVLKSGMQCHCRHGDAKILFCRDSGTKGRICRVDPKTVLLGTDPVGYAGCCAALRDCRQHANSLSAIKAPTLVIVGDRDVSTPWSGHGEILAREIPGARAIHLPAAHLSNLERPRSFTAALLEFLRPPRVQTR